MALSTSTVTYQLTSFSKTCNLAILVKKVHTYPYVSLDRLENIDSCILMQKYLL